MWGEKPKQPTIDQAVRDLVDGVVREAIYDLAQEVREQFALLSIEEVACSIVETEDDILHLVEEGRIMAMRVGATWRIPRFAFHAYLSTRDDIRNEGGIIVKISKPASKPTEE